MEYYSGLRTAKIGDTRARKIASRIGKTVFAISRQQGKFTFDYVLTKVNDNYPLKVSELDLQFVLRNYVTYQLMEKKGKFYFFTDFGTRLLQLLNTKYSSRD